MDPATPIRELILAQILTTIKAISAGNTYFGTFNQVERIQGNVLDPAAYPCCFIVEGDEADSVDVVGGSSAPLGWVWVSVSIELHFADKSTTARSTVGNKMIHDLKFAMKTLDNTSVSGVFINVDVEHVTLPLTIVEAPLVAGVVVCQVSWSENQYDPSSGRG